MSRLLLAVFLLVAVVDFADLQALGYGYRTGSGRYLSNGYDTAYGYGYPRGTTGYRFGYLYDPYASGSFRAPDLMDDPSFRAKQRVGRLFYSDPAPQSYHHQHPTHHQYPTHHQHPTYRVPTYHSH